MSDLERSFASSRCVVFGASGFLGSNLAESLAGLGADVVGFDLRPPREKKVGVTAVAGDILDPDAVRRVIDGADHIYAFAGGSGAVRSMADPLSDLRTSCEAQLVLLEAVRDVAPAASVVFPGSRLEYGKPSSLPVGEDQPLCGTSPYAIHKIACDSYYHLYAEAYALRTVVLRFSNPYGPHAAGDSARVGYGVLNAFVDRALAGEAISLYGDGEQVRDFIAVEDCVRAALAASAASMESAGRGRAINIGSGEGVSLRRAAEMIVHAAGRGSVRTEESWPEAAAAVETGDFYFDVSLARELLGWTPCISLEEGVCELAKRAGR
jgi:nucleoside-diphosphate-sugar epimerase